MRIIFAKYRQRRQNLHLALSFTRCQVYAGCMQHFACTGKKNKQNSTFASLSQSKKQTLNRKPNHWQKNLFQTKGDCGSLNMDLHPLLMSSFPCLFSHSVLTVCREGSRELDKSILSQYPVGIIIFTRRFGYLYNATDAFVLLLNSFYIHCWRQNIFAVLWDLQMYSV